MQHRKPGFVKPEPKLYKPLTDEEKNELVFIRTVDVWRVPPGFRPAVFDKKTGKYDTWDGFTSENDVRRWSRAYPTLVAALEGVGFSWEDVPTPPNYYVTSFYNESQVDAKWRESFVDIKARLWGNLQHPRLKFVSTGQWNFIVRHKGYFGVFELRGQPYEWLKLSLYQPKYPRER